MPGLAVLLSCACVARSGRLLLLEVGLEAGLECASWLLSRLVSMGSSLGMLYDPCSPLRPLRALAVESCL